MPMYDFCCKSCKLRFEELVATSTTPAICPNCKMPVSDKLFPENTCFMLKGTGWYATDYKPTKINE